MRYLIITLFFLGSIASQAQDKQMKRFPVDPDNLPIICTGHGHNHGHVVLPEAKSRNNSMPAVFEVEYDQLPPGAAIQAFDYALSILSDAISSPVPIRISVRWEDLAPGALAGAGPSEFVTDFPNSTESVAFPIALAEKIAGVPLNSDLRPDIFISIDNQTEWHYDFNNPSAIGNKFDFVSIVLHEMIHGLGFVGFATVTDNGAGTGRLKSGGVPAIFDVYLNSLTKGNLCQNVQDPSVEMKTVLTSNTLTLITPQYKDQTNAPRIYAPNPYEQGSSTHHLNQFTYTNTGNSLMTPQASRGEIVHGLGISKDILYDLGWSSTYVLHEQLIGIDDVNEPYPIKAKVTSDLGYDAASLVLHYSTDDFATTQTLPMTATGNADEFTATIPAPGSRLDVKYYFTILDNRGITLQFPANAPDPLYYETFYREDTELPVMQHTPLTTIDDKTTVFPLDAQVTDFFAGVDSVYVEYFINGEAQPIVVLIRNFEDEFRDNLYLQDIELAAPLSASDVLEYRIIAIDKSNRRNVRTSPATGFYTIDIAETFDASITYLNNFDERSAANDFSGNGFTLTTPSGFENSAIHSQHPYPNAGDGKTLNFNYQLNIPIQIRANDPLIEFEEIVLVEPGEPNTNYTELEFWDYVIVEGRKIDGTDWLPFLDGYDSRAFSDWNTAYNNGLSGQTSTTLGTPSLFKPRTVNMTRSGNFKTGDIVFVRFRLFSDPFAAGWGWAIENLKIQDSPVSVEDFIASDAFTLFPNPVSKEVITVQASFKQAIADLQLVIYDSFGRLIEQQVLSPIQNTITESVNVSAYPSGMYLVTLQINGKELLGKKVMVE